MINSTQLTTREIESIRKEALGGLEQNQRFTHRMRLPRPKLCNTCQTTHIHSEILSGFDKKGNFWMHCQCGSTLLIIKDRKTTAS